MDSSITLIEVLYSDDDEAVPQQPPRRWTGKKDLSVQSFSRELGEYCFDRLGWWLQVGDYIATTSKI
jgi:hypothetical protein